MMNTKEKNLLNGNNEFKVSINSRTCTCGNEQANIRQSVNKYQCPMKCEGGKTYDKPGNCPVCNMKLLPVG